MQFLVRLLTMIAIFGGFIYFATNWREQQEADAQTLLAPYNAEVERYLARATFIDAKVPATGRVIFVDAKTLKVEKLTAYGLSPNRIPRSPAEVDSVILHHCVDEQVGSYTNGSKAMQQICDVTVINVATGVWSKWGQHKGTLPPEEIKRKRGRTSDETGGRAMYSFFDAGGLDIAKAPKT